MFRNGSSLKLIVLTTLQSVGAGGGWLMGGGHGVFTNRFGLGVDNLLEVEIVLPNGDIVISNEKLHPDLFWAIRGGGGGTFGVLTKVTMKAHTYESLNGTSTTTLFLFIFRITRSVVISPFIQVCFFPSRTN